MPPAMQTNEFNSRMNSAVDEFLREIMSLVDEYSKTNDFDPGDRLLVLLYSGVAVTKSINTTIWKLGDDFMNDVIRQVEEKNDETRAQ